MQAVSAAYLAALASPQRTQVRAWVDKGGVRLHSALPIVDGSIEIDTTSITRRRLTLVVAPSLPTGTYTSIPSLPSSADDPLAACGQEITVQAGLTYTDGATEWLYQGVFRIEKVAGSILGDGSVTVTGVSREADVSDGRFWRATTRSSGSAQSLIEALLVEGAGPSTEVVVSATTDRRVPATTWDRDRWSAVEDLAESIGAVVYADPMGRFVVEDAPTVDTAPVWRVAAGQGGVLVSAEATSTRDRVYNAVVVVGGSTSSDVSPVSVGMVDAGTSSATRYGFRETGAWGKRPRFMSIPTVTTSVQAHAVAAAQIARGVGRAATLEVSAVPNRALEGGDVIEVITDAADPAGSVRRHAVDSMTVPLLPGTFSMSTRDITDVVVGEASDE